MNDSIYVTKTFLPPMEEYQDYLNKIWESGLLTNQGDLLDKFETQIKERLHVENFQFVSNGTMALQIALRAINATGGEIITTPFSYVATTSAILWEHCRPVFVDIDPETLCIDPGKIEAAITPNTKAIMPVHVFGTPCDTDKIEEIAKKHNLQVIYDGAHAFGVSYKGRSLLDYGDIAICSFHATKPFHTIEGGGIITSDTKINENIDLMKRFGHNRDDHIQLGINAKASEFQAAMGLCNLQYIDELIKKREHIAEMYDRLLTGRFRTIRAKPQTKPNFAYYPIIVESEAETITIIDKLNANKIFPRRYFYPALNTLPYVTSNTNCKIAEDISKRIICLPLYPDLKDNDVHRICEIIIQ